MDPVSLPAEIRVKGILYEQCLNGPEQILLIESVRDKIFFIEDQQVFNDTSDVVLQIDTDATADQIDNIEWTVFSSDSVIITSGTSLLLPAGVSGRVDIKITDVNGCIYFLQTNILLISDPEGFVFPNIIKPNSGSNGIFQVEPKNKIKVVRQFSLYDRWGNLQFNRQNLFPDENIWEGQCIGNECMNGVYVFMILIEDITGNVSRHQGDITIIK